MLTTLTITAMMRIITLAIIIITKGTLTMKSLMTIVALTWAIVKIQNKLVLNLIKAWCRTRLAFCLAL